MNLNILTIALILLGASIIITRWIKFVNKEKGQSPFKLAVTIFIWLLIIITALFPNAVMNILEMAGLQSSVNTVIFIAFVGIFLFLFKLLSYIERLESNITEIVRKEALKDLERLQE
jgi:hypothetical protein